MLDEVFCMELASQYAKKSTCSRGRCGAALILGDAILACGYNSPPRNQGSYRKCHCVVPSIRKPKSDRTCCIHAEWRVLLYANSLGIDLSESTLFFVRVDGSGNIQRSGNPYCTVCSRLALEVGVGYWALYHEQGIQRYCAVDYNDLSYNYDSILQSTT